jgi:VWFA-related protein
MRPVQIRRAIAGVFAVTFSIALAGAAQNVLAQLPSGSVGNGSSISARPITIPLTIRVKGAVPTSEMELKTVDFTVSEDGDPQTLLSIRTMGASWPLNLFVLIQDDVVSSVGLEMKALGDFIRRLPRGSRVAVGNLRTGTLQIRQKFTSDLEKAAKALRPPTGLASSAPYNPYVEVIEALRRFESQPAGRRAILLVSDGLDISRGSDLGSRGKTLDLERAINQAQRASVAVYAFFAPTTTSEANISLISSAQNSLRQLADETGGRAYFQGFGAPTSFVPFLKDLKSSLDMQIALTYLSTHPQKGFHRVKIVSSTPGVDVTYPAGYRRN